MNIALRNQGIAPAPRRLRSRHHVFHLGLSTREVVIVESMFRLHADLRHRYEFTPPTRDEPVDILFVDGDNAEALAGWQAIARDNPDTIAVLVCTNPAAETGTVTLARPLMFRNLDEVRYALRAATPSAALPDSADRDMRILVVDDSATARELLQTRLDEAANTSHFPLQVDFAISGEDALARAAEKTYDLVFLDVELPGIDGYEVCRQLKQAQPVRVVMLTGCSRAEDYGRGRDAGCDHYLAKPAPAEMVNTVVRLTGMKKALPAR